MAIRFVTGTPKKLLSSFKAAIDDGRVVTWGYDNDNDFTHTAPQWKGRAWLRPRFEEGKVLKFSIVRPNNSKVTSEVYAIYHGRIIESMLAHCDNLFSEATASAYPDGNDLVS